MVDTGRRLAYSNSRENIPNYFLERVMEHVDERNGRNEYTTEHNRIRFTWFHRTRKRGADSLIRRTLFASMVIQPR